MSNNSPSAARRRYFGGMNVARNAGNQSRAVASFPLAAFSFDAAGLRIGPSVRIGPFALMPTIDVPRDLVQTVYPSTGRVLRGVGVTTTEGASHFFLTFKGAQIVAQLTELGYPTGPAEQPSMIGLVRGSRRNRG